MSEYVSSVYTILFICGALSLLCYGSGRAEKTAVLIFTVFVIISPIIKVAWEVDIEGAIDSIVEGNYEIDADPSVVAEEAFAEGIKEAVAEKFLLNKENITVKIRDFDMKEMRAGEIGIFLSGPATLADYRGIQAYVNSLGMGECRVEIQFGESS